MQKPVKRSHRPTGTHRRSQAPTALHTGRGYTTRLRAPKAASTNTVRESAGLPRPYLVRKVVGEECSASCQTAFGNDHYTRMDGWTDGLMGKERWVQRWKADVDRQEGVVFINRTVLQPALTLDSPRLCLFFRPALCVSSRLEQAQCFSPTEKNSPCPLSSVLYGGRMLFVKLQNRKMKSLET